MVNRTYRSTKIIPNYFHQEFNQYISRTSWESITGKPTLALSNHNHDGVYATQTALDGLTTVVGTKASQTALDDLTTIVGTKAVQSDLDALSTTVTSKADASALDTLATLVYVSLKGSN